VEDKEYNASLKQARQGLLALQQALQQSGATFQNVDKATVEYARGLGRMEAVAKTAKGRIGEMTSAFTDLSVQYRHLTEEEKQSPFGQALSESLSQLSGRVREAKDELADITQELNNLGDAAEEVGTETSGSLSDMISVFGGNMMTKGAELAANAIRALGDEIVSTSKQAMEMSVQSEGIRMAFERLNRPGLLDNLREATHGTVSDLQLMQAAVRFDDFNLPLEELGTMLAFAQQKAKDTGQSVDYLVDSIVNGLGRQSTQILDNLGLSQAEVKERTKETGDMTVAVGEMIREQMQSAGDYVETAADRAMSANAEYENSLVELGDKMRETFNIGSINEVNMYLKNELIKTMWFTIDVIGRAKDAIHSLTQPMEDALVKMDEIGKNNGFVNFMNKVISTLGPLINVRSLLHDINSLVSGSSGGGGVGGAMRKVSGYIGDARSQGNGDKYTVVSRGGKVVSATHTGANGSVIDYTGRYATPATGGGGRGGRGGGGRGGGRASTPEKELTIQQQITKLEEEALTATDERRAEIAKTVQELDKVLEKQKKIKEELHKGNELPQAAEFADSDTRSPSERMKDSVLAAMSDKNAAVDETTMRTLMQTAIENGIDGIDWDTINRMMWEGMDIPDDVWEGVLAQINEKLAELNIKPIDIDFSTGNVKKQAKEMNKDWQMAASAIQAVGSAMTAIEDPAAKVAGTVAQAIATMALAYAQASAATSNEGWGWIAFAAIGLATMLSSIAAIKSATKGFANGGIVPGGSFSGDNLRTSDYGVNSGELILNRAQQDNIAAQLQGGGMQNLNLTATVTGEQIRLALNNTGRRTGNGEYLKFK
jgi:hypothetical protein